jgi:predicted nucleic acid-binding protein
MALQRHWPDFFSVKCDDELAQRAVRIAWQHSLRGYDAIHLAAALATQEELGEPILLATFDRELAQAAHQVGMTTLPKDLQAWQAGLG